MVCCGGWRHWLLLTSDLTRPASLSFAKATESYAAADPLPTFLPPLSWEERGVRCGLVLVFVGEGAHALTGMGGRDQMDCISKSDN